MSDDYLNTLDVVAEELNSRLDRAEMPDATRVNIRKSLKLAFMLWRDGVREAGDAQPVGGRPDPELHHEDIEGAERNASAS